MINLLIVCCCLLLSQNLVSSYDFDHKFVTKVLLSINNTIYQIDSKYSRRILQTEEGQGQEATSNPKFDLSKQTPEEANYLEYHRCFDEGEAYAAAYLITKEHLMNHKIDHDLASANTELASFIVFDNAKKEGIRHGTITMALDVFDYSVIHLSAYERLIRRHRVQEHSPYSSIEASTKDLIASLPFWKEDAHYKSNERRFNSTVAIMPWLGKEVGVGNSHVENRNSYLNSCFWSLYALIPNVVVGVSNSQDFEYLRDKSGLPFFEIILLKVPASHSLPLAVVHAARQRILEKVWDFDYIFFTESDQILLWRPLSFDSVFNFLDKYPRRVMVPHRLIPYPSKLLRVWHRSDAPLPAHITDWMNSTCCMPRQNCVERNSWVSPRVNTSGLQFSNIYSLQVALGNANFHAETFRHCTNLLNEHHEICP